MPDRYKKRDISELPDSSQYNTHIDCVIMHKTRGIMLRPWNPHYECFDDSDYDDHYCDKDDVKWWSLIPHLNEDFEIN